jgi:transporter family-2 protein
MSTSAVGFFTLALMAGALIPIQASSNALLTQTTGHVLYSALILFSIGLLLVLLLTIFYQPEMPDLSDLLTAPVQSYVGGFIVATYVLAITLLVPKIGVGDAVLFIVSGQILSAALIDHFALFGSPLFSLSPKRVIGLAIMIIGLALAKS